MNRVGIFCLLFLVSACGLQAHESAHRIPAAAVNADMAAKATAWLETLDDQ